MSEVTSNPRVILIRGSDICPTPVVWLWDEWLVAGAINLIGGDPGTGKNTITASFAATVSVGGKWPDGSDATLGDVAIWSGEDGRSIMRARAEAAGGDVRRMHFVGNVCDRNQDRSFDPAKDFEALRAAVTELPELRLIVIDPIGSAVAGDSNKNAEVRRSLQPLVDLADELGCAVVGITHLSKGTGGRDPVERITGSLAFGALARVVLVAANTVDGQGVLVRAKSNYGPRGGGFRYKIQEGVLASNPKVKTSWVVWGESHVGAAQELLVETASRDDVRCETNDATNWLRKILTDGPVLAREIRRHCENDGHAWRTVQRAMRRLGVRSKRAGFGQEATWSLPDTDEPIAGRKAEF